MSNGELKKTVYHIKNPYDVFHNLQKRENPKQSKRKSRKEWLWCTDKKKREIVFREIFCQVKKVANEENVRDVLKHLGIREVRELTGYLVGSEFPPKRPFLYCRKRVIENMRRIEKNEAILIKMVFDSLPFHDQLKYVKRFIDQWLGFFYKYNKWKSENQDFLSLALGKLALTFKNERNRKIHKRKLQKKKKFLEICMPFTLCKFPDVPEPPPVMNSLVLFQLMVNNMIEMKDNKAMQNAFKKLPIIVQNGIDDYVNDFREDFKSKLISYAQSLTEQKLRLFLGLKRKYYYKLFYEDVFEKDYPNAKYPLYIRDSDGVSKKAAKLEENLSEKISAESDLLITGEVDVFKLVDDSVTRLKNYGFDIDSSDSDT